MMLLHSLLSFALLLSSAGAAQSAPLPANYIHVDAPTAERLVMDVKSHHAEIKKLGLHAVPPAAADNVIIASETPAKVGKKSSPADLEKLAQHKALAVRIEKEGIYDLLLPITDAHGGDLDGGFVVMEVPFANAESENEALRIGVRIRDELQAKIPSRSALYQP